MKGEIVRIEQAPAGERWVAYVELEGHPLMVQGRHDEEPHQEPRPIPYWPELLEQWGAERLAAWLVQQAAAQLEPEPAPVAEDHPHAALLGTHEPQPAPEQPDDNAPKVGTDA